MFAVLSVIMQTNLSFAPFASNHGSPTKATTNRLSCPTSQLDTGHTSPSRKDRTARACLKSIGNFSGGRGDHLPRQRRGGDTTRSTHRREELLPCLPPPHDLLAHLFERG